MSVCKARLGFSCPNSSGLQYFLLHTVMNWPQTQDQKGDGQVTLPN